MAADATLLGEIRGDASNFLSAVDRAKGALGGLSGLFGGLSFAGLFGAAIKEASDAQTELAQLNTVLLTTKGAAGVAKEEVLAFADAIAQSTRFSGDAVVQAQNLMLTFTKVGHDVFFDATEAALDMSTAMGTDLKSSVIQIGKALNDPIKGITALTRVGVTFSKEQQTMIARLVRSGKVMEAQKIILKELHTEFGLSAEAAGQTFAGKLDILREKFSNVLEGLGTAFLPVLTSVVDGIGNLIDSLGPAAPVIVGAIAALAGLPIVLGAIGAVLGVILSPLGAIVAGVALVGAAFATNFGGIRTTIEGVWNTIKGPLETIRKGIQEFFSTLFDPKDVVKVIEGPNGLTAVVEKADLGTKLSKAFGKLGESITTAIGQLATNLAPAINDVISFFDRAVVAAGQLAAILGFGLGLALAFVSDLLGRAAKAADELLSIGKLVLFDTLNKAAIAAGQLMLIVGIGLRLAIDYVNAKFIELRDTVLSIDPTSIGYLATGMIMLGGALALFNIASALKGIAAGAALLTGSLSPLLLPLLLIAGLSLAVATNLGGVQSSLQLVRDSLGQVPEGITKIADGLSRIAGGDGSGARTLLEGIGGILSGLAGTFANVARSLADIVGGLIGIDVEGGIKAWEGIRDNIGIIIDEIKTRIETKVGEIKAAWDLFWSDPLGGFRTAVENVINGAVEWINNTALPAFKSAFEAIVGAAGTIFAGLKAAIIGPIKAALRAISVGIKVGGLDTLPGMGALLTALDSVIAGMAAGGPIGPGNWLVGERGPEIVSVGGRGYVTPNHALAGAGGGAVNITLNAYGVSDPVRLVDMVDQELKRRNKAPIGKR